MSPSLDDRRTRRQFIQAALAVPAFGVVAGSVIAGFTAAETSSLLFPTPACGDDDDGPTLAQTEGPYFKPQSPERVSLVESGIRGTSLVITGRVLSRSCTPVGRALLDFWQADAGGAYDNNGFRLRGHQFTDANGVFRLETVVPGLYPGRTRHLHVKVQAPGGRVLTTQLYFPGEPGNQRDGIFSPRLVMNVQDGAGTRQGAFTFVVAA